MTFRLIDYWRSGKLELVPEKSSERQHTYICPVCGDDNLKENLNPQSERFGSYFCFGNNCSTSDIRHKLGANSFQIAQQEESRNQQSLIRIVNRKQVPFRFVDDFAVTPIDYEPPTVSHRTTRIVTTFKYNETCAMERIDFKSTDKKKQFFPKPSASSAFKLFNQRYLKTFSTVLMAEGEKCADVVSRHTGLLCLSPPGFGWTIDFLSNALLNPHISAILFFPDQDEAGRQKTQLLIDAANSVEKGVLIFCFPKEMNEGEDIADFISSGISSSDLRGMINEQIKRPTITNDESGERSEQRSSERSEQLKLVDVTDR